ncbi:MAG: AMP phosphorylase [Candidatus Heimdallarchaeum aukensis]|uniref:AMP phosphorylase n=1 Tax=Candidatus Heimdallarchaeum aukensis TaxID=2876573 RepID=A0A9Y1FMC5_9ARCH|nr:MAG: AMP phosphorylase [Candidatus Heimdallarchaeum aukensis]
MPNMKAKQIDVNVDNNIVIINEKTLDKEKIKHSSYVKVRNKDKEVLCQVVATSSLVPEGYAGLTNSIIETLKVKEEDVVNIFSRKIPQSIEYVKKKRMGTVWTENQIRQIVNDICAGQYTDLEIGMFTLSQYFIGLTMDEIASLTKNMAEYGTTLQFGEPVYDKHSIGGVPGNKVSLLIVPTVAAAGLLIPKTSSRAITSPSGTADTMEVLAEVNFSADEILEIAPKVRGMLVWGGTLDLSPLDEIVIHRVERPLSIDPHSQMLASIFSKKISTGVDYLVLDMPTGAGTKMPTKEDAINYAHEATELGRRLGIRVEAALSYGDQPVGRAIGPALEAKEALLTLEGKGSKSVLEKSIELAGILFEMAGLAPPTKGSELAFKYIKSGKAKEKMEEIIGVQGGDPAIKPEDIPVGSKTQTIESPHDGYIVKLSNSAIKKIAFTAGAPRHKEAGVYLHKKIGEFVRKGEPLYTIYANSEGRLTDAANVGANLRPYSIEGMIIQRISSGPRNQDIKE